MNGTTFSWSEFPGVIGPIQLRIQRALRQFGDRSTPVTTLTYAQSLDGSIAAAGGRTLQLSNRESQILTHRLRALHDAILVGINTVLNDDPRLTVRLAEGKDPQPVVIDSRLRLPLNATLLRNSGLRPIVVTSERACETKERQLASAGLRVVRLREQDNGLLDLADALRRLKQMGIRTVMVEGGARIITSVLACGLADLLVLTVAPTFVGGVPSIAALDGKVAGQLPRLRNLHYQPLADDLVIVGDLGSERNGSGQEPACLDRVAGHSATT
jgi:riboflavin-specific deaminase-like protein